MNKILEREIRREAMHSRLQMLWRNKLAILVSLVCLAAVFFVFLVLPGAVDVPDFLQLSSSRPTGPTSTDVGTVVYLTGGRVKMMVVEYGDFEVTMLAPLAAKAGDAVDVTHSVRYPNRVVGVRLHGQ